MWKEHFKLMAEGKLQPKRKMYSDIQKGGNEVQIISPTEAIVEQAKSDLKRSLSELPVYKPKKIKLTVQSGGGKKSGTTTKRKRKSSSTKKKTTSKKRTVKKKKI